MWASLASFGWCHLPRKTTRRCKDVARLDRAMRRDPGAVRTRACASCGEPVAVVPSPR